MMIFRGFTLEKITPELCDFQISTHWQQGSACFPLSIHTLSVEPRDIFAAKFQQRIRLSYSTNSSPEERISSAV
jgi:hypothetical protein